MNTYAMLLAQTMYNERFQGLRNAFVPNQSEATDISTIVIFFSVILTPIVVLAIVRKLKSPTGTLTTRRPMRMFCRSLKQMGVRMPDRLLLRHIAGKTQLKHPAVILFSEELFERHTTEWLEALPMDALRTKAEARLRHVATLAFGESPGPADPPIYSDQSPEYAA